MLVNSLKTYSVLVTMLLASQTVAKTDLSGCVSSKTVEYGGASLIWYVPDTGEICAFLDCGGGRAPPKTTVPGCAQYSGTATYSPSYLPGFDASATASSTDNSVPASTSTSSTGTESASSIATITAAPTTTTSPETISSGTTSSGAASTETNTSASSNVGSSSPTGSSQGAGSTSVSQAAAAMPTAVVKGAMRVVVGLVAGVVML
ncbi:hypothetical protein F4804DRAFT_323885 [Jackrogersella minutella]|nr:hypothetical protein F4804DRAFT_323885 [Jackrogersella minutella]